MILPILFSITLLQAPAPKAKPLPFVLKASAAYGEPDRFEDRPFDQEKGFRAKDGKVFTKEGRWHFRQWHFHKENGEEKPSALQVHRNIETALRASGAEIMRSDEAGHHITARSDAGAKPLWIRVDTGADYWGMYVIEEESMRQEFSADFLGNALARDGFVALDVHFASGADQVLPESLPLLDRAAEVLKAHPEWKISVEGHTDSTGDAAANRDLSLRRARSVMAALVQRGLAPGALSTAGFGPDRPVSDNRLDEGRARNRRVELVRK